MANIFEAISKRVVGVDGGDENFNPTPSKDFRQTEHDPGTVEKIKVLRERLEKGEPLWHPDDKIDINTAGALPKNQAMNVNVFPPTRKPCDSFKRSPKPLGGIRRVQTNYHQATSLQP